jgi:hypothetical protein
MAFQSDVILCHTCSCFCDIHQGFTSSSTKEAFCISFFSSATTQAELLVTVISNKSSLDLLGSDFVEIANQKGSVDLPPMYSLHAQGSLDVLASGYYTFCVTASGPARVSFHILKTAYLFACFFAYACLRTMIHD